MCVSYFWGDDEVIKPVYNTTTIFIICCHKKVSPVIRKDDHCDEVIKLVHNYNNIQSIIIKELPVIRNDHSLSRSGLLVFGVS